MNLYTHSLENIFVLTSWSSSEDEYVNPKKSSNLKRPPRINLDSLDSEIPTSVNNEPLVTLSRKSQNDSGDIASSCGMPSTFTTAQCDHKLITLLACCVFTTCLGKHQELSTLLLQIKEQNNQILAWIRSQSTVALLPRSLPEKFPVSFPLRNNSHVEELKNYIALKENLDSLSVFLSSLGGRDVNNRVNVILRYVFDDRLASTYNFCGKRSNKTAIKDLHLRKAIIDLAEPLNIIGNEVRERTAVPGNLIYYEEIIPQYLGDLFVEHFRMSRECFEELM
ncbi:hypothetical protein RN001_003413 [Aquatica leii]|uniref:DUF4806 domain-containing protein n=1 Tax=Aquatica leii TaxID=1421715 RepID=A0AAN7PIA6_9COLE|nr:hypothetical protein RN001_003413 [Aquatica leii]